MWELFGVDGEDVLWMEISKWSLVLVAGLPKTGIEESYCFSAHQRPPTTLFLCLYAFGKEEMWVEYILGEMKEVAKG